MDDLLVHLPSFLWSELMEHPLICFSLLRASINVENSSKYNCMSRLIFFSLLMLIFRNSAAQDKNQFIICVFGLSQEQAKGMTSMYDLTFVNETSLIQHIQTVV